VGDGESDRTSAQAVGCDFRQISPEATLPEVLKDLL
jgi:hypothetical protein